MWTRQGRRRGSAAVFQVDDISGRQKEKHLQGDLENWAEKGERGRGKEMREEKGMEGKRRRNEERGRRRQRKVERGKEEGG